MSTVSTSGPIFDGRADRAARDYADAAGEAVAEEARQRVVARLKIVIQNPTPFYWTQIDVDPIAGGHVVDDNQIVYGPWLEGVGSLNDSTRFKGYGTFRIIGTQMQQDAQQIAEGAIAPYLARMQ